MRKEKNKISDELNLEGLVNRIKRQFIEKEKGAITLFSLIICLFLVMFLLLVNIGLINKNTNQEKQLEQINKMYTTNATDMESIYSEATDED